MSSVFAEWIYPFLTVCVRCKVRCFSIAHSSISINSVLRKWVFYFIIGYSRRKSNPSKSKATVTTTNMRQSSIFKNIILKTNAHSFSM